MEPKALVNTMHQGLAEVEAETSDDTLRDVEAKESANTLPDRVAEVRGETVGKTLRDVKGASPV